LKTGLTVAKLYTFVNCNTAQFNAVGYFRQYTHKKPNYAGHIHAFKDTDLLLRNNNFDLL